MKMPFGMRASTLEEREKFYKKFNLKKARDWIGRDPVYAVIVGRHSGVFLPQYKDDKDVPFIIDNYSSLSDVKSYFLKYLPEGVYYDRNYYHDMSLCHSHNLQNCWNWKNFAGQELAFDIDPENVLGQKTLEKRMKKSEGLSFTKTMFEKTRENTLALYDELTKNYSDVRIVFSGRGFHIHVFDKDTIYLTRKQRSRIACDYERFGIDKFVTDGEMRLIRLPYSLNGTSNRIVTPITKSELQKLNPEKDAVPFTSLFFPYRRNTSSC